MSDFDNWIGRISVSTAILDPEQANRMAVTLDRDPAFQAGDLLPRAWHWLYFHDMIKASDLGLDGHPEPGIVMPRVPLPRRMWAGGSFEFKAPVRLGDAIRRTSEVRSITEKVGRSGRLCFVTVEHVISTGDLVNLVEEQTIVYREATSHVEPRAAVRAPSDPAFSREYVFDSTALFRYSALTFNGHRIHYDADYCRKVEGYPNVVVHGPLVATLLLDLCVRNGYPPERFTYRATSPIFLGERFRVNGAFQPDGVKLWAAGQEGGLAMEATASRTGAAS